MFRKPLNMVNENGWKKKTRKKAKPTDKPKTVNVLRRDADSTTEKENSGAHGSSRENASTKRELSEKEQFITPRVTRGQIRALSDFETLNNFQKREPQVGWVHFR